MKEIIGESIDKVLFQSDGILTISANKSAFRNDFRHAISNDPDINQEDAFPVSDRLQIYVDKKSFLVHVLADFRTRRYPWHFAAWIADKAVFPLYEFMNADITIAETYASKSAPAVFFNLEFISKLISDEDSEASPKTFFNERWLHERKHLLRMLNPQEKAVDRREKILRPIMGSLATGVIFFGSYLLVPETKSNGNMVVEIGNLIRLLGTLGFSFTGSSLLNTWLWNEWLSGAEKAAREDSEHLALQSRDIFDVRYHKYPWTS